MDSRTRKRPSSRGVSRFSASSRLILPWNHLEENEKLKESLLSEGLLGGETIWNVEGTRDISCHLFAGEFAAKVCVILNRGGQKRNDTLFIVEDSRQRDMSNQEDREKEKEKYQSVNLSFLRTSGITLSQRPTQTFIQATPVCTTTYYTVLPTHEEQPQLTP